MPCVGVLPHEQRHDFTVPARRQLPLTSVFLPQSHTHNHRVPFLLLAIGPSTVSRPNLCPVISIARESNFTNSLLSILLPLCNFCNCKSLTRRQPLARCQQLGILGADVLPAVPHHQALVGFLLRFGRLDQPALLSAIAHRASLSLLVVRLLPCLYYSIIIYTCQ